MSISSHILDSAESLFNERGYTAVGIDLIRDTAHVSKTTMYRHFQSKQRLIYAVLERRDQRLRKSQVEALAAANDGMGRVRAVFEWHFRWFQRSDFKGCMFMHALAEFKSSDEDISRLAKHHKCWLKQLLYEQLPEGNRDREGAASFLMTMIEGLIVQAEFGLDLPDRSYIEDTLKSIFLETNG